MCEGGKQDSIKEKFAADECQFSRQLVVKEEQTWTSPKQQQPSWKEKQIPAASLFQQHHWQATASQQLVKHFPFLALAQTEKLPGQCSSSSLTQYWTMQCHMTKYKIKTVYQETVPLTSCRMKVNLPDLRSQALSRMRSCTEKSHLPGSSPFDLQYSNLSYLYYVWHTDTI